MHENIKSQIKEALLKRDAVRLTVLRGLLSSFTNELIAKGQKPQETLGDEEALTVIKRSVKQRRDSIEQYRNGGRDDLVKEEELELKILETFLPESMPADEIKKIAEAKKAELGIDDKSKLGILIGTVIRESKGRADGAEIKNIVESLF